MLHWPEDLEIEALDEEQATVIADTWRQRVVDYLESCQTPALGESMRDLLLGALGVPVGPNLPSSVQRYPTKGPSRWPRLILWRANLIDYLSDQADVLGIPAYPPPDCEHAMAFLLPSNFNRRSTCPLCLQDLGGTRRLQARHYFTCPIQTIRAEQESSALH